MTDTLNNPPSPRRAVLIAAVLGLTLIAIVADERRVRTGELLVQSDRGDVRVTIHRDGRPVTGPTQKRSFTLLPGDYGIEVEGASIVRVSVIRGERAVLRIEGPSIPPETRTTPGPP